MNKVFKKSKCRYTSTGLFKRFQDNKWTVDWSQGGRRHTTKSDRFRLQQSVSLRLDM